MQWKGVRIDHNLHALFSILNSPLIMSDLFDFFKENESKLHERPPEQVWQKLEKRLEKTRRPRRQGIRFLQVGTIALVLALLLLAAVLVWYFVRKN